MGKNACRYALLLVAALPACSLAGRDPDPSADASRRRAFEYGVLALETGDYRTAVARIAPVAAICPTDAVGRRAMLLLASVELDPRNPEARADAAAELAAFQLARRAEGEWEGALARELYTLAIDYGATPIAAADIPDAGVIWNRYLSDPAFSSSPAGIAVSDTSASAATVERAGAADANEQTVRVARAADGGPLCDVRPAAADIVMPELTRAPLASRAGAEAPATPRSAPAQGDSRALQAEVERLRAALAAKEQELDRIRRTLRP